jgi:hypothetical protein
MTTQLPTIARRDVIYAEAHAPPFPELRRSPGRAKVMSAVQQLQDSVSLLHACLRAEQARERREAVRRRTDADLECRNKERSAAAAARIAMREQMVSVDRKWFWSFMNELLDEWRAASSEARTNRDQAGADQIDRRVDALCAQLEKVQKLQLTVGSR